MKIVELSIENIKRVKVARITPTGAVVPISGMNGSGKSSVLDSILWTLGGERVIDASKPVRRGEERGVVKIDLGEYIIERTFSAGGTTKLFVRNHAGAHFTGGQTLLKDLIGKLSFDPLQFAGMNPKEQVVELLKVAPVEIDLDVLDNEIAQTREARRLINAKVSDLETRAKTYFAGIVPDMDVAPIDTKALLDQMESAAQHNAGIEKERAVRAKKTDDIADWRRRAQADREKIEQLKQEIERLSVLAMEGDRRADDLELELKVAEPLPASIDVSDVKRQAHEAEIENQQRTAERNRRQNYRLIDDELKKVQTEAERLTTAIKAKEESKAKALANVQMPVPGLEYGEGEVLFNGLPFTQASGAEQLRVSFALAAAANPKLRVVLIKDGALLDQNSLGLLAQLAEERDCQVWIERVGPEGTGILMEDGEVAAVDGVPVEREPETVEA